MRKLAPFRMNAGDNTIMVPGADDFTLWCQYYFDGWTPKWYQHQFHHAPQKDRLFVAGIRTGKMERLTSPILTPSGWKLFGDLRPGDQVFGFDGCPTTVTAVHPIRTDQKCYEVIFSDGSVVPCGGEHLWLTHDYTYRKALGRRARQPDQSWITRRYQCRPHLSPKVLTTEEIAVTLRYRNQFNHAVPVAAPLQFPTRHDLPIAPYLLGVWLGDGAQKSSVISTSDPEILKAFTDAGLFPNYQGQYDYNIISDKDIQGKRNEFTRRLRSLGVLERKFIPDSYQTASVSQRLSLLQGLMDTDGTIDKRTGMCTFDQSNDLVTEGVKFLLASLGIQSRHSTRVPRFRGKEYRLSHRVSFTPTIPVFRLSRKLRYQRLDRMPPNRNYRYIVAVRAIPAEPMRCISVAAPDGLYLTGRNLIPTHNTKGIAASFLHYAYYHPNCRIANASISADQANIVYNDVIDFASRTRFQHWIEKDDKHPYPKIRLVNGAEMWFRSIGYEAELWRGHEFDWINIDEAGYVQREMAIKTLKGRLIGAYNVGGIQIQRAGIFTMTTSPRGKGWLFERWKRGDPNYLGSDTARYFNLRARTRDNDSLSVDQIEDLEAEYSSRMIRQELEGLFLDSEGVVFPYDQIMYACSEEVRPEVGALNNRLQTWLNTNHMTFHAGDLDYYSLDPIPGHIYMNSWDLGKRPTKSGRNAMVGGVLDISARPHELVAWRYAPGASYGLAHEWITEWGRKYGSDRGTCETVVDATGKGDVVNERLEEEEHLQVDGMIYSAVSKPQMIMAAELAFEKGWVVFPFLRRAVDQLQGYERDDKMLPQDIVMMLSQALYRARQRWGEGAKTKATEKSIMASGRPHHDESLDRFRARRSANRAPRNRSR